MRKVICVFLLIGFYSLLSAQYQVYNQSTSEKPTFGIYAAEFGGALLGTTGCVSVAGGTFFVYYLASAEEFERGNYLSSLEKFLYGFAVASTILIGIG